MLRFIICGCLILFSWSAQAKKSKLSPCQEVVKALEKRDKRFKVRKQVMKGKWAFSLQDLKCLQEKKEATFLISAAKQWLLVDHKDLRSKDKLRINSQVYLHPERVEKDRILFNTKVRLSCELQYLVSKEKQSLHHAKKSKGIKLRAKMKNQTLRDCHSHPSSATKVELAEDTWDGGIKRRFSVPVCSDCTERVSIEGEQAPTLPKTMNMKFSVRTRSYGTCSNSQMEKIGRNKEYVMPISRPLVLTGSIKEQSFTSYVMPYFEVFAKGVGDCFIEKISSIEIGKKTWKSGRKGDFVSPKISNRPTSKRRKNSKSKRLFPYQRNDAIVEYDCRDIQRVRYRSDKMSAYYSKNCLDVTYHASHGQVLDKYCKDSTRLRSILDSLLKAKRPSEVSSLMGYRKACGEQYGVYPPDFYAKTQDYRQHLPALTKKLKKWMLGYLLYASERTVVLDLLRYEPFSEEFFRTGLQGKQIIQVINLKRMLKQLQQGEVSPNKRTAKKIASLQKQNQVFYDASIQVLEECKSELSSIAYQRPGKISDSYYNQTLKVFFPDPKVINAATLERCEKNHKALRKTEKEYRSRRAGTRRVNSARRSAGYAAYRYDWSDYTNHIDKLEGKHRQCMELTAIPPCFDKKRGFTYSYGVFKVLNRFTDSYKRQNSRRSSRSSARKLKNCSDCRSAWQNYCRKKGIRGKIAEQIIESNCTRDCN